MSAETEPNNDAGAEKKARIAKMRRKMMIAMAAALVVTVIIFSLA